MICGGGLALRLAAASLFVSVTACSASDAEEIEASERHGSQDAGEDEGEPAVGEAEDQERHGGESYGDYDERRDAIDPLPGSVGRFGCTVDCSGHQAGYDWAEEKGITSPDQCGGKSWSFEEGCRAYAEEQGGDASEEE